MRPGKGREKIVVDNGKRLQKKRSRFTECKMANEDMRGAVTHKKNKKKKKRRTSESRELGDDEQHLQVIRKRARQGGEIETRGGTRSTKKSERRPREVHRGQYNAHSQRDNQTGSGEPQKSNSRKNRPPAEFTQLT